MMVTYKCQKIWQASPNFIFNTTQRLYIEPNRAFTSLALSSMVLTLNTKVNIWIRCKSIRGHSINL